MDTHKEMATPNKYKSAFPVALAIFALVNIGLYFYMDKEGLNKKRLLTLDALKAVNYEKRQEGPWVWWVTKTFLSQEKTPDVVLLGSSQMGSAIFSAEAEHRGEVVDTTDGRVVTRLADEIKNLSAAKNCGSNVTPQVFNFSMGGAMVSDHYLLANTLFKPGKFPKVAIIGVNPRDFIDNSLPSAAATDSFHFLSPYADIEKLAPVSYEDGFGYLDYQMSKLLPLRKVPLLVYGDLPPTLGNKATFTNPEGKGAVREKGKPVTTQVLRAISGSAGDVRKGEWALPAFPPYLYMDNSKEYIKRYKTDKPKCLAGQKKYFEALLSFLHDNNVKVIVVGMPSQVCNRNLLPAKFWTEFSQYLSETTTGSGGTFVNLFADENFIPTKDYLDTVHLNRWGGGKLVHIMAETAVGKPEILSSLQANSNRNTDSDKSISTSPNSWH